MRSLTQIKNEIIDDILALRSDIRIVEGDPQYDVVVASPANQFFKYEVLLELEDRTRNLDGFTNVVNDESFKATVAEVLGFKQDGTAYTIADVNDLISARLDAYVADWNIIRSVGEKASGIAVVYLTNSDAVSWDNGTTFSNKSGDTYVATSSVANVVPNFDNATGLYFVSIPIEASVAGSASNASVGSVVSVDPKPTNFSYTNNTTAIDGGSDGETDLDLIDRAQDAWTERVNGSKAANEGIAEAESYVDDAVCLDEDDDDNEIYIGSPCDVVTQFSSEDTELVEEIIYWQGESGNINKELFEFTPTKQPMVSSFTPIIFKYTTGGVEEQVVIDTTATVPDILSVVKDTSTFAESPKANDKIKLQINLNTNDYQRRLRVLYLYDKSPAKLQKVFDDSENKMIGPAVLVKKAVEVPIRVIAEIQIAFGYEQSAVETAVESNISIFFNGGTTSYGRQYARKEIGEDIAHSDIANVILRTDGVVSYDNDTFFVVNTLTAGLDDPTVLKPNEYATLFDVLFTFSNANLANFTGSFTTS